MFFVFIFAGAPAAGAQSSFCGDGVTVADGDTLSEIAARCNTTVPALMAANPDLTNPNLIYAGQRLNIPASPQETIYEFTRYRVERGDTLSELAAQYGTSLPALLQLNPQVNNPDLIYPYQLIRIPTQTEPETGTVAMISPSSGPPGSTVQFRAQGLPADTPVEIGVGRVDTEYNVMAQGYTTAQGTLTGQVSIPEWADPNEPWVVVVTPAQDQSIKAISNIFSVTSPQLEASTF